jgi:diguanylate cyclase
MLLSRDALVSALFSETDRALRMKVPLALIAVGLLDDLAIEETRESRLTKAHLDEAMRVIVGRFTQILRSYDSVGRIADAEFIVALPGCILSHAKTLAERIREEVFGLPVQLCSEEKRLNACYGVASSSGRSPLVVLLEAERALQRARAAGSGSIQCSVEEEELDSVTFLLPAQGDESLHW